jgi:hypothetical protein
MTHQIRKILNSFIFRLKFSLHSGHFGRSIAFPVVPAFCIVVWVRAIAPSFQWEEIQVEKSAPNESMRVACVYFQ